MTITTTHPVQIKFHPAVAELAPELAIRKIEQLSAENATLRQTLIDVAGQRDEYHRQAVTATSWRNAIQAELDKALQERSQ